MPQGKEVGAAAEAQIFHLYHQGASCVDIARELGLCRDTIKKYVKKLQSERVFGAPTMTVNQGSSWSTAPYFIQPGETSVRGRKRVGARFRVMWSGCVCLSVGRCLWRCHEWRPPQPSSDGRYIFSLVLPRPTRPCSLAWTGPDWRRPIGDHGGSPTPRRAAA